MQDHRSIECGNLFTGKLEGMFKDMELSKDIMTAFDQVDETCLFESRQSLTLSLFLYSSTCTVEKHQVT